MMIDNNIGDEGVKSVSSMLKENTTLTELDLRSENEREIKRKKKRNE